MNIIHLGVVTFVGDITEVNAHMETDANSNINAEFAADMDTVHTIVTRVEMTEAGTEILTASMTSMMRIGNVTVTIMVMVRDPIRLWA